VAEAVPEPETYVAYAVEPSLVVMLSRARVGVPVMVVS